MYIASDIDKIAKIFKKTLAKYELNFDITVCNSYKAIKIESAEPMDRDSALYLWIRLMDVEDTYTYNIDIANIVLPKHLRRTGILTDLIAELSKCKYVNKIRFISVCTFEMKNWCDKHGFKPCNYGADYSN